MGNTDGSAARWQAHAVETLQRLEADALLRRRRPVSGRCGPRRTAAERPLLTFASNDYLGLAGDPRIVRSLSLSARQLGVGAGSAQLLGGYSDEHALLEAELADWLGRESAVLFSTGYMANLGLVGALVSRGDPIVQDKRNHASLLDAARLSRGTLKRYAHADMPSLQRRLEASNRPCLVLTESVFSMDGDRAPVSEVAGLCTHHGALLCVDEAHALGVLGPQGAGLLAGAGLGADQAPVITGTLGKSLGTFGAFVAGPEWLTRLLVNSARSHIYTTAPPPALAAASRTALTICREEDWRREALAQRIEQLRAGAARRGLAFAPSDTPIQPLIVGSASDATRVAGELEARGIWVPAIRPPTVPAGTARLRVSLSCAHQPEDVDRLLDALAAIL